MWWVWPWEMGRLSALAGCTWGVNSHGGISLGTRPREIGRDEIKQAVERARAIPLPADREVLHLLPQEFILDGQSGRMIRWE